MSKHFRSSRKNKSKAAQAHDLPILEDDEESKDFSGPILPNFAFSSTNTIDQTVGSPPSSPPPPHPKALQNASTVQSLVSVPSSIIGGAGGDSNLRKQIDDDFDKDFSRDAALHNSYSVPANDTSEFKRQARKAMFELHENSSSGESTEDEADAVTPIYNDDGINSTANPSDLQVPPPAASVSVGGGRRRALSLRERFRRFTVRHEEPINDIENQSSSEYREKASKDEHEDASSANSEEKAHIRRRQQSIFGKILGMDVNPGMTPSSSNNGILDNRHRHHHPHFTMDLEKGRDSIDDPMIQHVDPSQFKEEARDMVKLHYNPGNASTLTLNDTLGGSTLNSNGDGQNNNNNSQPAHIPYNNNNSFYTSNPEIMVDDFDDLKRDLDYSELNIPESKVQHKRVKKGIASALLALYQPGNVSQTPSVYTPSVMSSGSVTPRSGAINSDYDFDVDVLDSRLKSIGVGLDNASLAGSRISLPLTQRPKHKRIASSASSVNLAFSNLNRSSTAANEELHHNARKVKFDTGDKTKKTNANFPNFLKTKSESDVKSYGIDDDDDDEVDDGDEKKDITPNSNDQGSFLGIPTPRFSLNKEKNKKRKVKTHNSKTPSGSKGKAKMRKRKFKKETVARITVHIADVLQRQRFILLLCKALMLYGAPTHRLEEYMSMTAQVLEIDGSFIYLPGTMIVSFGDAATRTSDMKLVRCPQGVDLGKLDETYDIYKNVVHDRVGVEQASSYLENMMNRKPKFNPWVCIFLYGFCSAFVGPWAFGSSWIDIPICFGIGLLIGFLQFVLVPKSSLYSSVFEVTASILVSFIGRALGSINGGSTFCFAAIVQSTLALILPGYIILCGSLELQSRNLVAGAVRMFYAFIYSLMLSFGITLGSALYGWIDESATNTTTCTSNVPVGYRFLFVPMFTIGIALVNQASYSQLPLMVLISEVGYIVNYFASKHFTTATELNATLGCFIVGLLSNLYTRLMKSCNKVFTKGSFMTVSLMLPAIFVQVPSGIASQGSLLVGVTTANEIVHSNSSSSSTSSSSTASSSSTLNFGLVMIQVALGISVGLYLSTIVVYPTGKKRTGLFTL